MPTIDAQLGALMRMDDDTLEGNAAVFESLVRGRVGIGRSEELQTTVFWAQVAAEFAWMNHPGYFTSLELEDRLSSSWLPRGIGHPVPVRSGPPRVLHVLTRAYSDGGHTRLAWRWMRADRGRKSSVVLTGQAWCPIPRQLSESVAAAGGSLTDLSSTHGGLLARATALRRLMADADIIVLHVHPYDTLPILALATWVDRPPVLFMNHADHVFWVGATVSDVVVNIRDSGARLASERRGVEASRLVLLPIPIDLPERIPSQMEARERLGLDAGQVVALSVASSYKFEPHGEVDFVETLIPVLTRVPNLTVLAVGPSPQGRWAAAEARSLGRLRALGVRSDLDLLYRAADLYMDSLPLGSLTSLLEAGSHGLPLVTLRGRPGAEILSTDLAGLEDVLLVADDPDAYARSVIALAEDRDTRVHIGERTRQCVGAVSSGEGWLRQLESVYATALTLRSQGRPPTVASVAPRFGYVDHRLAELHGWNSGLGHAIMTQLRFAPPRRRVAIAAGLRGAGRPVSALAMAPDWATAYARGGIGSRHSSIRRFLRPLTARLW
jgi:glycosyltransferase involved in cell wall biosynthesis